MKNTQSTKESKYFCEQCGKPMGIMEYILGPICGPCCRENHARVCNRPIKIKHSKRLTRESGQIIMILPAFIFLILALIAILWILGYTPTLPAFM